MRLSKSNDIDCSIGQAGLTATGGTRYLWSPAVGLNNTDVPNPIASPSTSTTYHVQVRSSENCIAEDSIQVLVKTSDTKDGFLVPNAFTPNNDGLNDCFGIQSWGAVSELRFSVFDRWGKLVFSTGNPTQCWDGRFKDKLLSSGTYVYVIQANTRCGPVLRKGSVTLIR